MNEEEEAEEKKGGPATTAPQRQPLLSHQTSSSVSPSPQQQLQHHHHSTTTSPAAPTAHLSNAAVAETSETMSKQSTTAVILFYKYHPLSNDFAVTEIYRSALERLCVALHLTGRILVGSSRTEGLNGTLAGASPDVRTFTAALCGSDGNTVQNESGAKDESQPTQATTSAAAHEALLRFRIESRDFFHSINTPELQMEPSDFKWSVVVAAEAAATITPDRNELFPDLRVKLVSELIGSGGILCDIPLEETSVGYLTPHQWHDELLQLQQQKKGNYDDDDDDEDNKKNNKAVLIDCRNAKEYAIGHFEGALDPKTTTFAQFPQWVHDNEHLLANKIVYMYCTGGIRCEKASAYVRRTIPSVRDVKHLKGGIHKYLEEYGGHEPPSSNDCNDNKVGNSNHSTLWKGRNFVFDGRGAASADETRQGRDGGNGNSNSNSNSVELQHPVDDSTTVVGRCLVCHQPHDTFDPHNVCTVCREPTLVCDTCQAKLSEFHCKEHFSWNHCYFSNLMRFTVDELRQQRSDLTVLLESFAIGRKFKSKRKTLSKQIGKIDDELQLRQGTPEAPPVTGTTALTCRHCHQEGCSGRCWGFFGLKRKEVLAEQRQQTNSIKGVKVPKVGPLLGSLQENTPARALKEQRKEAQLQEVSHLRLSLPPSAYRDSETGVRVPPCTTRILQCFAKGKWCGQSVVSVVKHEFAELARPATLQKILQQGLLRVNDATVDPITAADVKIRIHDVIGRIVHWHEPPVLVPASIQVTPVSLPTRVVEAYKLRPGSQVYVCNKPASVPVHPAGPYLANTLTLMVEAQETFPPLSLSPLHRTDRVTSGLTLCSDDSSLSRLFHTCMTNGQVRKLYLAQVRGRFYVRSPGDAAEATPISLSIGRCVWVGEVLQIEAAIETADPANGLRAATAKGKPSCSHFRLVSYDPVADTSLVACFPITGRNHQLRVHLQLLGYPILGDVQYGGPRWGSAALDRIVTDLMQHAIADDNQRLPSLTDDTVRAAKRACTCCLHGVEGAFTKAQLLQGGHAIRLHALCYQLTVLAPKTAGDSLAPLGVVDFGVDPPDWAGSLDIAALKTTLWQV